MKSATEISYIYALFDPRDPETIRYIGKTEQSLGRRLTLHLVDARNRHCYRSSWIRSIQRDGVRPGIRVLKIVPTTEWQRHERELIALHDHPKLTNGNAGGIGGGPPKAWVRAKMRASRLRIIERLRPMISLAVKKLWANPAYRERMSKAHLGKIQSPESRLRRSLALRGRVHSAQEKVNRTRAIVARQGIKVINKETGQEFESIAASGRSCGANDSNIGRAILRKGRAGGFHWIRKSHAC